MNFFSKYEQFAYQIPKQSLFKKVTFRQSLSIVEYWENDFYLITSDFSDDEIKGIIEIKNKMFNNVGFFNYLTNKAEGPLIDFFEIVEKIDNIYDRVYAISYIHNSKEPFLIRLLYI